MRFACIAHQDPQYNVLYRDVNMHRSFVDAAEAKQVMTDGGILQLDGAHNANATAKEAWKVTPELFVQHAINSAYSRAVGMPEQLIALSTVPPTAPPAPKMRLDLPYAVALRELFAGYKFRAQQNTRYMESDTMEASITHVLDTLISRMTSTDIQSTITPDEGRNIPWHYNNIAGVNTARQTLMGIDGLMEQVELKQDGNTVSVAPRSGSRFATAVAGTMRSIIANMAQGVSEGFERKLELVGVGYRAQVQGKKLNLTLGFSHPVDYPVPEGITVETPSQTDVVIKGVDKQKVGQVAAEIRAFRPPEPYKGKGVKYADEIIVRKEAKKK